VRTRRRKPSHERLYREINARVVAYEFPQGKRIYLGPIAEEHGTSTWPVRQVFDQLAAEGLVIKAPNKGFYTMTLNEEEVTGWYLITRHLISLALETLGAAARRRLSESESIVAVLNSLNRHVVSDPEKKLATATAKIFGYIADLTGKRPIVDMIDRTNDQLFYVRTLECRRLDGIQYELIAFCELLLADDRETLVTEFKAYHDRRLAIVPELVELSRR
jgi:DNA-binding GntR family transcriptional regulator